jgi:hypothetical protein
MNVADWEDTAGEGFRHVTADRVLTINRAARLVTLIQPGTTETD